MSVFPTPADSVIDWCDWAHFSATLNRKCFWLGFAKFYCKMAGQSWRLCAKWLIEVGALPQTAQGRVNGPDAQILDLANLLRDGVVLCQLLNFLRPLAVDLRLVSLRSQMSLVSLEKNVPVFLDGNRIIKVIILRYAITYH